MILLSITSTRKTRLSILLIKLELLTRIRAAIFGLIQAKKYQADQARLKKSPFQKNKKLLKYHQKSNVFCLLQNLRTSENRQTKVETLAKEI